MKFLLTSLLLVSLSLATPNTRRQLTRSAYVPGSDVAIDVDLGVCAPLTVLHARGTNGTGNINSIVGPPLFTALLNMLDGNVALQGVNYTADFLGYLLQGAEGAQPLADISAKALAQCPMTKVAISGHSQGASVLHFALNTGMLPSQNVSSVVYFADPQPDIVPSGSVSPTRVKKYCNHADVVCEIPNLVLTLPFDLDNAIAAHLSYGANATSAAEFIEYSAMTAKMRLV